MQGHDIMLHVICTQIPYLPGRSSMNKYAILSGELCVWKMVFMEEIDRSIGLVQSPFW